MFCVWLFTVLWATCYGKRPVISLTPQLQQYIEKHRIHHDAKQIIAADLPTNFDGRTAWPGCIHPVLDQGACESCWAFAATGALSDRLCIHSNGSINVVLSPQATLSCEKWNLGCAMGSLPNFAWSFLQSSGVPTISCVPYTSGNGSSSPCPTSCRNGETYKVYKASNYSQVGSTWNPSRHVETIMRAVMQGPVDATFNVWSDFLQYRAGQVYEHKTGSYEGLHSVKVVGFGVQNNVDYWLVQNSWGPRWGENGFFKIRRGVDECFFEALVYTGFPAL